MDWNQYKQVFLADGFPRHIQAEGLTLSGWNRCYRVLRASDARMRLYRDGEAHPLPQRLEVDLFCSPHRYLLNLDLAEVALRCHIDDLRRLDLEFDPAGIDSESRAVILFRIMSMLGRRLQREIVLTHPVRLQPLFRYRPGAQGVEYFP